jgi:chemotaxis protein CheZ
MQKSKVRASSPRASSRGLKKSTPSKVSARRKSKPGKAAKPAKRGRAKLHPNLSSACDELHATVTETENAANRILAAAEELGRIADMTGTPAAKRIVAVTAGIFEASAFQDITGQRIRKVIGLLREMENPRSSTGLTNGKNGARSANKPLRGEKALLNGPQLAGEGCSQSDIDALLASMD